MPMGGGQHAGQNWDAVGGSTGARSSGHPVLQHSSPHPEQSLPMPALEKRPSDLLHAFAQVTFHPSLQSMQTLAGTTFARDAHAALQNVN